MVVYKHTHNNKMPTQIDSEFQLVSQIDDDGESSDLEIIIVDDKIDIPKSVYVGISIMWGIIIGSIITCLILDPMQSSYYSIGPSYDLKLFPTDLPVDTWLKYSILMLYLVVSTFATALSSDLVMPWINNTALNTEKTCKYSKRKRKLVFGLLNLFLIPVSIESVVVIGTSFTQIDFALASMTGTILAGFYSGYYVILKS